MKFSLWAKAAKATAIDYLQNTSLTGFKLLFNLDKSNVLQVIWIPFLLTGLVAAVYITGHYILFFELNPTVTYINTFQRSSAKVPFPAVSICSVNKISNRAMWEYVDYVYTTTAFAADADQKSLMRKFNFFGGFYDISGFDIDEAYGLQTFLDKVDSESTGFYNVSGVLRRLAPKCESLLRKCSWKGKVYPCVDIFDTIATPEGICCIFNYHRVGRREKPTAVRHLNLIGIDNGLKVLLNTSVDDYFFTQRSTIGFIVQVFNSLFFPDILAGKINEFPVAPNTDIKATLSLTSLNTDHDVREYNVGQRGCLFADERPQEYGAHYSQPECLVKCRLQSIKSLCNCIPYYTPDDLYDPGEPVLYCTLSHLECLSRYKFTWAAYRPLKKTIGLEQEMEDALRCSGCVPLCDTNEYEYELDAVGYFPDNNQIAKDEFLNNETNLEETSLLRVFYNTPYALQYKKRAIYSTDGFIANVGGILGISIGCSVISLIEIFYFGTIRLYNNFRKYRKINAIENAKEQEANNWK